ncbi:MAG: invasion associated locus B family protein [Rhodobacteraceae bacterium]|nr:invasion associated locus B family protein [Paracoccaceae bacterium]
MTHLSKTLPLLMLLAMAAPALAQSTETGSEDDTGETPNPLELSMGEEASDNSPGEMKVGDIYVAGEHGDWEQRCIKAESGTDPCQLYQLLDDGNGNPVAEINVFPIGGEGQPAAGATVITPLETLLTQQLGMSVDGGPVKKYPYSWCSKVGCFSRIGYTQADIDAFKRGINAALIIVPVAAPDQKVTLTVSLKGFTAGFDAVAASAAQ